MTPREARAAWVAALRSGEFKQTAGVLTRSTTVGLSHCCLGVACELFAREHPGQLSIARTGGVRTYDGHDSSLPHPVRAWLGLRDNLGDAYTGTSLADLNDTGAPFTEIADTIEAEPEGLLA